MEKNILINIERLKHDFADLKAEIQELSNSFNQAQVSNSRKRGVYTSAGATCEAILKFIYQKDSTYQKPVKKMMLDELLIKVADELPAQVMINFQTIQAWRNLGTHDKDDMRNIDSNSLIMVDMALSNIVNWFFSSYLNIEVPVSINNKIEKKEESSKTNKTKTKYEIKSPSDLKINTPAAEAKADNLITIKSPFIGTFYRTPNPESPVFVNVGDEVKPGKVVCIIEAMKCINEIESEISGKIVKVLVENATPIMYDQPLFLVEPA